VQTRVELFGHLQPDWDAFAALSTDRPMGMAHGPIPWTSIDRYAARYGIIKDDFDRLAALIRSMDKAFLSYKKE
jgi:hypothetical protein